MHRDREPAAGLTQAAGGVSQSQRRLAAFVLAGAALVSLGSCGIIPKVKDERRAAAAKEAKDAYASIDLKKLLADQLANLRNLSKQDEDVGKEAAEIGRLTLLRNALFADDLTPAALIFEGVDSLATRTKLLLRTGASETKPNTGASETKPNTGASETKPKAPFEQLAALTTDLRRWDVARRDVQERTQRLAKTVKLAAPRCELVLGVRSPRQQAVPPPKLARLAADGAAQAAEEIEAQGAALLANVGLPVVRTTIGWIGENDGDGRPTLLKLYEARVEQYPDKAMIEALLPQAFEKELGIPTDPGAAVEFPFARASKTREEAKEAYLERLPPETKVRVQAIVAKLALPPEAAAKRMEAIAESIGRHFRSRREVREAILGAAPPLAKPERVAASLLEACHDMYSVLGSLLEKSGDAFYRVAESEADAIPGKIPGAGTIPGIACSRVQWKPIAVAAEERKKAKAAPAEPDMLGRRPGVQLPDSTRSGSVSPLSAAVKETSEQTAARLAQEKKEREEREQALQQALGRRLGVQLPDSTRSGSVSLLSAAVIETPEQTAARLAQEQALKQALQQARSLAPGTFIADRPELGRTVSRLLGARASGSTAQPLGQRPPPSAGASSAGAPSAGAPSAGASPAGERGRLSPLVNAAAQAVCALIHQADEHERARDVGETLDKLVQRVAQMSSAAGEGACKRFEPPFIANDADPKSPDGLKDPKKDGETEAQCMIRRLGESFAEIARIAGIFGLEVIAKEKLAAVDYVFGQLVLRDRDPAKEAAIAKDLKLASGEEQRAVALARTVGVLLKHLPGLEAKLDAPLVARLVLAKELAASDAAYASSLAALFKLDEETSAAMLAALGTELQIHGRVYAIACGGRGDPGSTYDLRALPIPVNAAKETAATLGADLVPGATIDYGKLKNMGVTDNCLEKGGSKWFPDPDKSGDASKTADSSASKKPVSVGSYLAPASGPGDAELYEITGLIATTWNVQKVQLASEIVRSSIPYMRLLYDDTRALSAQKALIGAGLAQLAAYHASGSTPKELGALVTAILNLLVTTGILAVL